MAGQTENDPEGRLLTAVRELLGPSTPLVASLDLHAVLTDTMVEQADLLVPFHTYPHVDQYQTGARAAACLLRMLDEPELKPVMVRLRLPMLVRGDELITGRVPTADASAGGWSHTPVIGQFGGAIEMCQAIEADDSGIAAGVLIGNAFTDVPDLMSNILVARDGSSASAEARAEEDCGEIGQYMWERRETRSEMRLEVQIGRYDGAEGGRGRAAEGRRGGRRRWAGGAGGAAEGGRAEPPPCASRPASPRAVAAAVWGPTQQSS